jgi:plasmid maintenance system antidote protein VapI
MIIHPVERSRKRWKNRVGTGKETISGMLAWALSSVFDIDASFWITLQATYDKEMPQAGNGAYVRFVCAKA